MIPRSIQLFLLFMLVYHVLHTFLGYGLELLPSTWISLGKDLLWILIISSIIYARRAYLISFFRQWKSPLILLSLLCLWALGRSLMQNIAPNMLVIGFKYDIRPLCILVSALFVGYSTGDNHYQNSKNHAFLSSLVYRCIAILGVGLLRQLGKIIVPEFYHLWGYGAVGDYIMGTSPPLYYRTGPGGIMRGQGLFAGPNNYGFWLVAYASVISLGIYQLWKPGRRRWSYLLGGLFFISLLWTLSRGAWLAVMAQGALWIRWRRPLWRKWLWVLGLLCIASVVVIAQRKTGSTTAHINAWWDSRAAFSSYPWGYGLGSAGPAVHRDGVYLPENHYLQLLLDIGVLGTILWCLLLGSIAKIWRRAGWQDIWSQARLLGCSGLLFEGLFLHVFEDSMVNYLFLVPLGIYIGRKVSQAQSKNPV